jgi:hypothetical protein
MMPKSRKKRKANRLVRLRANRPLALGAILLTASCVPSYAAEQPLVRAPAFGPALGTQPVIASGGAILDLPPPPSPVDPTPFAAEQAATLNAEIPLSALANPAARPFQDRTRSASDQLRALDCLTAAVYYEARSEGEAGERAVAQVVLNRVRHPAYPASVCGVVYQGSERSTGCQFTFTCDGSLAALPIASEWQRARAVAASALAGNVYAPVGLATHYHTFRVFPQWATRLVKSAVIGAHIFYRLTGGWGVDQAFRQSYAGAEPAVAARARSMAASAASRPRAFGIDYPLQMAMADTVPPIPLADPNSRLPLVRMTGAGLPRSGIREAYLNSGMPRDGLAAPIAQASLASAEE